MSKGFIYGMRQLGTEQVRYIGMTTTSIEKRFLSHKKSSRKGVKYPVYDWMRKHGEENIEAFLVEIVEEGLEQRELFWISHHKEIGHSLLNLTDGGIGPNGHVWTEEQRSAQSVRMKEIVNRPEVRLKIKSIRKPYYGPKHSEEQKAKWSQERKGLIAGDKNPNYGKFGAEHPAYGRKLSEEKRKQLSEQKLGENNPNYGRTYSEEERKRMSLAQKGKPKPNSSISAHTRYHVNRNGFSEKCKYCIKEK